MAWVDVCRGWIPIAYTFLLQGLQHALWKWKSYEKNRPFLGFILKVFCKQVQLGMVNNILKCIHICIIPEFLRWIPTIGAFKNHSGLFQHPFLVEKTWEIPWKILPWKKPLDKDLHQLRWCSCWRTSVPASPVWGVVMNVDSNIGMCWWTQT